MGRAFPVLAAAVATLAGCGASTTPEASYFPLQAGHRWTYDLKTEWENNTIEHETLVLTTEGSDSLDDGPAWRRRSASGVDYWLRADATGVFRVATKSDLDESPRRDAQPRYVLKAPLAAGTSWQSTTTAYVLRRRQEFPPEIRHTHPKVPMTYAIEAVGEAVDTRAGKFSDCIRVKGQAVLRLYADPVVGWRDMPMTTLEWYCKGAGLVRLTRQEPANSTFLTGGSLTLELLSWQ